MNKNRFFCLWAIMALFLASPGDSLSGEKGLKIPDELWRDVLKKVGAGDKLGIDMGKIYGGKGPAYRLPLMGSLFKDIRKVPEFTGSMGDFLLGSTKNPDAVLRAGYFMLNMKPVPYKKPVYKNGWGPGYLDGAKGPGDVLRYFMKKGGALPAKELEAFEGLPSPIQKLVARLLVAHAEASGKIRDAFDLKGMEKGLYEFASSPWNPGFRGEPSKEALKLPGRFNMMEFGEGSSIHLILGVRALNEFHPWFKKNKKDIPPFGVLSFGTLLGRVSLSDGGGSEIEGGSAIHIDLGGDDVYSGEIAVARGPERPVATLMDFGGNDKYHSKKKGPSLGCGLFGSSALFDLSGSDIYRHKESGIGSALYGSAFVMDFRGNDKYITEGFWGQGAAHVGVGVLLDLSGSDFYFCGAMSQAFGSTLGAGILMDVRGNDKYQAHPKANISKSFQNKAVSFAQGAGFGRRRAPGKGTSLAGGVGILVEGEGNDTYLGNVYSQGAGYFWSLGAVEDRGGNDTYKALWYSQGSAPHFAIGSLVDSKGNDTYNPGGEAITQYQGSARDLSMAVFMDGAGDDTYFHRNRCAGFGDLNSVALFWDRDGNDIYNTLLNGPYKGDPPFGGAAVYKDLEKGRKAIPTYGIFLDTGGKDVYNIDPKEYKKGKRPEAGNNREWRGKHTHLFRSLGMDIHTQ